MPPLPQGLFHQGFPVNCAEGLREGLPAGILANGEVVQEARRPAQPERPSGQVPGSLLRPLIWVTGADPKAGFRGAGLP